jgi:hypothetical protein
VFVGVKQYKKQHKKRKQTKKVSAAIPVTQNQFQHAYETKLARGSTAVPRYGIYPRPLHTWSGI